MQFKQFFIKLGFTPKEANIFLSLYKLGTVPASTIAKQLSVERTGVYKTLNAMAKQGIVSQTMKKGVKHFFVPSPDVLSKYIHQQQSQLQSLEQILPDIEQELVQYESQRYPHLPKISLFDGNEGIKSLYQDIYETVITNNYLVIKFFASNTFETQTSVNTTLRDYYQNVFQKLKKKQVTIDTYLGNGILIMEHITKTTNIDTLADLPAGNSSINIFVVGKVMYLVIFKDIPFGIKIDSEDVANAMHFLFEKLEVE